MLPPVLFLSPLFVYKAVVYFQAQEQAEWRHYDFIFHTGMNSQLHMAQNLHVVTWHLIVQ
jgi:hypothetical protein